ncbi:hypothetical protein RCH14_003754 [Massilia sp. MP_M2]|uniref:DUF4214 domain-containing protein n=1 Tax=Massilia sp. MP_M2 TaxID=3071713 RepID=UPI00319E11AE
MAVKALEVQQLYVAYFGRPADPGGLDYWMDTLAGNVVTLGDISRSFADSQEYRDNYSHMDSRTVVTKVYDHLFGREAEAAGIKYWADLIDRGVIAIDDAVREISDAAVGADAIVFDGKVAVASVFTLRLDTPNEVAAYGRDAAFELAMAFLATVNDARSALDAADPVVVDAWIARIVGADGTAIEDVGLVGVAPLA